MTTANHWIVNVHLRNQSIQWLAAGLCDCQDRPALEAANLAVTSTRNPAQSERRSRHPAVRFQALLKGFALAAKQGLREHERWRTAGAVPERKTKGKRVNSHMGQVINLVIARPIVTAAIIATELGITERSARDLVAVIDLRELTGRARYRACGIL